MERYTTVSGEYPSITDAHDALINSGVLEMFDGEDLDEVAQWMMNNQATPEQAANHFGVS